MRYELNPEVTTMAIKTYLGSLLLFNATTRWIGWEKVPLEYRVCRMKMQVQEQNQQSVERKDWALPTLLSSMASPLS